MPNYQKIFSAISSEVDDFIYDLYAVKYSYMVKTARGNHLDKIGSFVKYPRPFNLNDTAYRRLLLKAMLLNTGAGTKDAIYSFLTSYLNTDNIDIWEPKVGTVTIVLDKIFEPRAEEIRTELQQLVACGIRIDILFGETYWNEAYWDDSLWV